MYLNVTCKLDVEERPNEVKNLLMGQIFHLLCR